MNMLKINHSKESKSEPIPKRLLLKTFLKLSRLHFAMLAVYMAAFFVSSHFGFIGLSYFFAVFSVLTITYLVILAFSGHAEIMTDYGVRVFFANGEYYRNLHDLDILFGSIISNWRSKTYYIEVDGELGDVLEGLEVYVESYGEPYIRMNTNLKIIHTPAALLDSSIFKIYVNTYIASVLKPELTPYSRTKYFKRYGIMC